MEKKLSEEERKQKRKDYKKAYNERNKEKRKEYDQKRYIEHKERLLKSQKEYRDKTKRTYNEEQTERRKNYYRVNKVKINEYMKTYNKKRREEDPMFKIKCLLRSRIAEIFRNNNYVKKSKTTQEMLGCSFDEFKRHLESKFEPWMNWDNQGLYNGVLNHGWDIDHIEPLNNAKTEDDVYRLNHYTNLQPLCSYTNRVIKRNNF